MTARRHPARVFAVEADSPWYDDVLALDAIGLGKEVKPAPDSQWFAAVVPGRGFDFESSLVAYAAGRIISPGTFMLTRAATRPEHRGRGLQQRLIRARVALAKRLGCKRVVTYTSADNAASMRALIRTGFLPYVAKPLEFWMGYGWVHWRREF